MKKLITLFIIAIAVNLMLGSNAHAQVTQVTGSPQNASSGAGSLVITRPSGAVAGTIMIANISQVGNSSGNINANPTAPAGWTLIAGADLGGNTERWGSVFYKVITGAEAASYSFTLHADANGAAGSIVAFSGVDLTGGVNENGVAGGPFDVDPGSLNVQDATTITAPAITTSTSQAGIVMLAQVAGSASSYATWAIGASIPTFTQLYSNTTTTGDDASVGAAFGVQTSAGTTGNGTVNHTPDERSGAILIALKSTASFTVNAGVDQLVAGTTVTLSGSTTAGSPVYAWTQFAGPAGPVIVSPSSPATSVTGLVSGNTYTFRLTVNGIVSDDVVVRALTGTNLWASSSSGTQIASYTVAGGVYTSGPTTMFAPSYPSATNTYTRTAALGRTDKPTTTAGHFYWLGTSDGANENNGLVEVFASSATGGTPTRVTSIDLNGAGNGAELGFVRLGMGPDGTGYILAGDGTTLYLASFMSNGVNTVTTTIIDASVALTGGTVPTFVNGDLCIDAGGRIFALANNGSGVTQIFIGTPSGATTTLVKKWDLVDPSNAPFTGSVNGVAFDLVGALYISTSDGLYYIDPATVNGPAGTVECSLVQTQSGLQDLASNVFPNTTLLPIKLGSFTVTKQGSNAMLNWTTESELNTDHFEIERSYDGINFVSVGSKTAAGTSFSSIAYNHADPINVASGIIYYRLKTVDIDFNVSYSKIIPLRLSGGIVKNFTVYPNPFTSDLKIELNTEKEADVTVRISNAMGQTVVNRTAQLQKGTNVIVLTSELSTLKAGMYIVEVISEDGKQAQKIIKR